MKILLADREDNAERADMEQTLKKALKLRQGDQADYAEYFQNFFSKNTKNWYNMVDILLIVDY